MTKLGEMLKEICKEIGKIEAIDKHNGKKYKIIKIDIGKDSMEAEYENGPKGNFGLKYHLDDELVET